MRENFNCIVDIINLTILYLFIIITDLKLRKNKLYFAICAYGITEIVITLFKLDFAISVTVMIILLILSGLLITKKLKESVVIALAWILLCFFDKLLSIAIVSLMSGEKFSEISNNYLAVAFGIFLLRLVVLLFIVIKNKLQKNELFQMFICTSILTINACLITVVAALFSGLLGYEMTYEHSILFAAFFLVLDVLIIIFNENNSESFLLKSNIVQLNELFDFQRAFYEKDLQMREQEHKSVHDMKNYFLYLKHLAAKKEWEQLEKEINAKSDFYEEKELIKTGDEMLDVIVNNKKRSAELKAAELVIDANIKQRIAIEPADFSILLGNAIDNAIEGIPNGVKGRINISVTCEKGCLKLLVKNPVDEKRKIIGEGFCATTKSESGHGYGLLSIKSIVEKYDGVLQLFCDDFEFVLRATLFWTEE